MGMLQEIICPGCAYTATVSGGDDCGMMASTTTVVCAECRKLFDVTTKTLEGKGPPRDGTPFREVPVRCLLRRAHHVTPWTFPGPCPRCATAMVEKPDGQTIMWD